MKENKQTQSNPIEGFAMTVLGFIGLMYLTLLYKAVWNWFLADKLFEVGYWELLLGVLVVRFIILGTGITRLKVRLDEKLGKPKFQERFVSWVGALAGETATFIILFIINLVVSYYS